MQHSQPDKLIDEAFSVNHALASSHPKFLKLFSSEKLRYCKVELVLIYHVPNHHGDLERYAYYVIFVFYPFGGVS